MCPKPFSASDAAHVGTLLLSTNLVALQAQSVISSSPASPHIVFCTERGACTAWVVRVGARVVVWSDLDGAERETVLAASVSRPGRQVAQHSLFPSPWNPGVGGWLRSTGLLFQYHFVSGTLFLPLGCLPHFDPSCFLTLGFFVVPGSLTLGSQLCLDLQNSHSIANSVLDPQLNQSLSLVPFYLTLFCNAAVFCVHSGP